MSNDKITIENNPDSSGLVDVALEATFNLLLFAVNCTAIKLCAAIICTQANKLKNLKKKNLW